MSQVSSWKDPVPNVRVHRRHFAHGWQDVPIHFTAYGDGAPAIVCCNGVGVSTFFWKYVVKHFAPRHRVVTWDYRGHNGSGLPEEMKPENFTMTANARDLLAVLNAAQVDKAVLLGHSMGCQVLFEFWHLFPERVAGLIPICGPYGHPLDTFFLTPAISHPLFDALHAMATLYPREVEMFVRPLLKTRVPFDLARFGLINAQLADFEDMRPYFEHLSEMNIDVFFLMAREMQNHDAGAWLGKINVPTLVVGGEQDLFTPLSLSQEMCDRIAGAEMLVLPKGSHAALIEHPELLNLRIEKFLNERVAAGPKPGHKPAGRKALPAARGQRVRRPAAQARKK